MARQPMVTRTITSTQVTLMCVDTVAGEVCNHACILPRTYKDKKSIMKTIEKMNILPENMKMVDVVDTVVNTQLYGIPEEEFVRIAQPIIKEED